MKQNKPIWILDDGARKYECSSFPLAFKQLFNLLDKAGKNKVNSSAIANRSVIIAPWGKVYNYEAAVDLAKAGGVLAPDGTINSKEFDKKHLKKQP